MKHPLYRYLVCLFAPPAIGALSFLVWDLAPELGAENIFSALPLFPVAFIFGFVYCFIPGNLFFFAHEGIVRLAPEHFRRPLCYILLGGALGLPCGLAIGYFTDAVPIFAIIGILAGTTTAWINHPCPPRQGENPTERENTTESRI